MPKEYFSGNIILILKQNDVSRFETKLKITNHDNRLILSKNLKENNYAESIV